MVYFLSRALQLIALIVLPSSIWVGHFDHNEPLAIMILLVSVVLFAAGYFLCRIFRK